MILDKNNTYFFFIKCDFGDDIYALQSPYYQW